MKSKKKNEMRLCPTCKKKRRHLGYHTKLIHTSNGLIEPERRYEKCYPCGLPAHAADAVLGLEEDYTVGFRMLAVYAGSRDAYEKAEEDLKVYRGLEISRETIRIPKVVPSVFRGK